MGMKAQMECMGCGHAFEAVIGNTMHSGRVAKNEFVKNTAKKKEEWPICPRCRGKLTVVSKPLTPVD